MTNPNPTDDNIRQRARQLWNEQGKVGQEEEFWNQAECQLQGIEEREDLMKGGGPVPEAS